MRTPAFISLFLFVLGACTPSVNAEQKVASFSALPKGDELEVTFRTSGCFHFAAYELTFRRSKDTNVSVTQIIYEGSPEREAITATNRIDLGQLSLSKSDLEGLDKLLRFYRNVPEGRCTTVEGISISQRHEGRTVATEKYVDGSCAADYVKDVRTIPALVKRLTKPK